jgi:DNA-binding MarR family transcriptional regulator/N-acetylglutamate synthase-like GNAT family acetyltransferase
MASTGVCPRMTNVAAKNSDRRIDAVRRFNRLYTRQLGLLEKGLLRSPFSLTEVRVLYELAHGEKTTATALGKALGLDAGYLSRILAGFERRGLLRKQVSPADGRQALLVLSKKGRTVFAGLDERANEQIRTMLDALSLEDQGRLLDAMRTCEEILAPRDEARVPYVLRPHQPGDMGWVVHRHGILYAREYGWNEGFEALIANIVGAFIEKFDPRRERCWIAERDGVPVGSVFLVKKSKTIAQLRLLLVEPSARGLGIGARLVDECSRFARQAGYKKIILWTNSVLVGARRIYERAGYTLVREEPHHSFGHDLIGQTWELDL